MNARDVVRRLRAYQAGRPLPRGERLSIRLADSADILVVAFVRMGGESRPWGIVLGHPGKEPTVLTVPEARDRDLVSKISEQFASRLLSHLRSPAIVQPPPGEWSDLVPIRQIWLPNASHLEMLHNLAYAYTFTRSGGNGQAMLNALGRTAGWLFREAQHPGSQHVVVATSALKNAFTFPSEDVRQGHLGYLLAWLAEAPSPEARNEALGLAEQLSMSTTLDPAVERKELEPLLESWRVAQESSTERVDLEKRIHRRLGTELRRRFDLTADAWRLLRADPRRENKYVEDLVTESLKRQWSDWARIEAQIAAGESPFVPAIETDLDPRAAAAAFQTSAEAAELVATSLLQDDRELLAEAVAEGNAFFGEIVRVDDEGTGRSTVPVWFVLERNKGPLRIREGSSVSVVGLQRRTASVRSIRSDAPETRTFELVLTNLKKAVKGAVGQLAVAPNDRRWIGQEVAFTEAAISLAMIKKRKLWASGVPGAWLTMSRPSVELGVTAGVEAGGI